MKNRSKIKIRLNQKGQVAIFTLLIFSLLFMFFGMSINIAMLVHHKINLQNAADMAAMAGAAEQARIMNLIAWKNYELRKNFKDFMYAYWVEFNDRHYDFPDPRHPGLFGDRFTRNISHRGDIRWTVNPMRGRTVVPSYCLGDDFGETLKDAMENKTCDAQALPVKFPRIDPGKAAVIRIFDPFYSGPILAALDQMAVKKEFESRRKWKSYSERNELSLRLDIATYRQRARDIYGFFLNPNNPSSLPAVMNSVIGNSWDTSESFQNAWRNFNNFYLRTTRPDQDMSYIISEFHERPQNIYQLAYLTSLKNLNRANLISATNGNSFFQQLEPENGYIQIAQQAVDFDMFWTEFIGADDTDAASVIPQPQKISIRQFPVAIKKVGEPTFYAVTLETHPALPFLPSMTDSTPWKLTAVSAAQPFGSRIGPKFREEDYTVEIEDPARKEPPITLPHICLGEECDGKNQFKDALDNVENLYALKAEIGTGVGRFNYEELGFERRAPILHPTQWEIGRYNLPDETSMDKDVHPTDLKSSYGVSGHPFSIKYGGDNTHTSWNRARAGYGIKLIPIGKIINQLDPASQAALAPVNH